MWDQLLDYDRKLLVYLNNLGTDHFDQLWTWFTSIEFWIPLFLIFFFLVYRAQRQTRPWLAVITVLSTLAFTMTLTQGVKWAVGRLRPGHDTSIEAVLRVLLTPDSYSFFSGHAANSFAVTTVVVLLVYKKYPWAVLLYLWPLIFSFSRIYVGVHYPSDILVGMLVGLGSGFMGYRFYRNCKGTLLPST